MQDFSAHIMDIAQNSVRANARCIEINIEKHLLHDTYVITVIDDGCGMDTETLLKVADPFFTSRIVRKVGLGIPLLKQNAEATGGSVEIISTEGKGTTIRAIFAYSHIDCPPCGNIPNTIVLLATANPDIEVVFKYKTDNGEYVFNSFEVKEILYGVPLYNTEIIQAIQKMISDNIDEID